MAVDSLEKDFPTSGLMQSDMLPGFDGQSIDDYLDSNYMSTLPGQHDFDPGFYFGNNGDSFDSTPVDSLSGKSSLTLNTRVSLMLYRHFFHIRTASISQFPVRLQHELFCIPITFVISSIVLGRSSKPNVNTTTTPGDPKCQCSPETRCFIRCRSRELPVLEYHGYASRGPRD